MKNIRILISLILVLSLVPVFSVYSQEITAEVPISETEEFKKLQAFGIILQGDEIAFSDTVTRGMFMQHIMRCCFSKDYFTEEILSEIPFSDVTASTAGAMEIAIAQKFGIINGNGGAFRPNENITFNESAKILVTILGYSDIAQSIGDYPGGYVSVANRLGVFKGCRFNEDGSLSTKAFLKALINTLETEVIDIESLSKTSNGSMAIYSKIEGRNLLQYVFGIFKEKGIVTSNGYTSLNGLSEINTGMVEINDKVYFANGTDAEELLGYNTEFYYRESPLTGVNEIVYITPYNNATVEVTDENIIKDATTVNEFKYYSDSSQRKIRDVKIAKSATLIYNGGLKKMSVENLCPENGDVILIDNNIDGIYDVARVMSYSTILVAGISQNTHTVSDMLGGNSIVLDPEDKSYDVIVYKDGVKSNFSSIEKKNVISYAESTGNKKNVKYVIVSTKTAEGTIDSVSDKTVGIDGKEYPCSADVIKDMVLGEYGSFYLDFKGRIVAKKLSRDVVYGYLNAMESKMLENVRMKIFTENNRWVVLDLNEKIKYNSSRKDSKDVYDELSKMSDFRQLITYTVDKDGKINMITTAKSFPEYSVQEETAIEQDVFRVYPEIAKGTYRSALKSIDNYLVIGGDTKIFMVPDQSEREASDEDFYILNPNELHAGDSFTNIIPYDLDRTRTADALVFVGNERKVYSKSSFVVVDTIITALNSDGEWVDSIKGYYKNTLITLTATDNSVYKDLTEPLSTGDVVQIAMDDNGNISKLVQRYNYSDGEGQKFVINGLYSSNTFLADVVYYADAQKGKIIAEGEGQKIILGTDGSTLISVYDSEEKTLIEGTISDLEKGNSFIAMVSDYVIDEIVVYH